ncbi:MAG: DUF423 domain-containing protein [Gammaproteobacteria bacterium]|nr:DUF423 domain-containing protein [Gammaproteobacteria bacterium]
MRTFALLGAVFGGVAVALGAFAAHALAARVEPRMLEVFETAARYQMFHALALFAVAWVGRETRAVSARLAGWAFVIGIVLFSGSLYAMVFTGVRALGMITPLGGVAFIVGWLALAFACWRLRTPAH